MARTRPERTNAETHQRTGRSPAGPVSTVAAAAGVLASLALSSEAHPAACAHATARTKTELWTAPGPGAARHKLALPAGTRLNLRSCQYRILTAQGPRFYCKLVKTSGALEKLRGPAFARREHLDQPQPTSHCSNAFRDPFAVWQHQRTAARTTAPVTATTKPGDQSPTTLEQQLLAHIICADTDRNRALIDHWGDHQWQRLAARLTPDGSDPLFDGATRAALRTAIIQRVAGAYQALRARHCTATNQARQTNAR